MIKLIFFHADKQESSLQIDTNIFDGDGQSFPKSLKQSLQCLQNDAKKVRDEVDFLHADKHQSFLQVDFNTLPIKIFCKLILSLLMGMVMHSQVLKVTSLQ